MLSEAIEEIHRGYERAEDRRQAELRRRAGVRQVDCFLLQVENLIEGRQPAMPEPLMEDIIRFVRPISRKLHRALSRNVTRDPVRVLDVLFDAQQLLMARPPSLAA
jgi:hypothetical protein